LLKPALRLMSDYRLRSTRSKVPKSSPLAGVRGSEGIGKSGGLRCVQSEVRTYLARIKEASPGVRFPETSQSRVEESVFFEIVRFGEKARHGWKEEPFFGAAPKSPANLSWNSGGQEHQSKRSNANVSTNHATTTNRWDVRNGMFYQDSGPYKIVKLTRSEFDQERSPETPLGSFRDWKRCDPATGPLLRCGGARPWNMPKMFRGCRHRNSVPLRSSLRRGKRHSS
jgi:hypothetical protein